MSRSWSGGSTRRWRTLRASVLSANALETGGACTLDVGRLCQKHGRPCPGVCTGTAEQVHHAKGKALGDSPADLVPACKACNQHVGQPGQHSVRPRPVSSW